MMNEQVPVLRLTDLKPFLSVIVLECVAADLQPAFGALRRFLRSAAADPGRAEGARVRAEIELGPDGEVDDHGVLGQLGFDELYGVHREVVRRPAWVEPESDVTDVANELGVAARRDRLVAVHSDFADEWKISRWIRRTAAPFRCVPSDLLAGTFHGDARMLWVRGAHRRRATKADGKALTGLRLQDALNAIEDGTYTLSATTVDYQPDEGRAVVRDRLTVSPDRSRVSWKRAGFRPFLIGIGELLDAVAKGLAAGEPPIPPFRELAVIEKDLSRVRGAFDVLVPDPEQLRSEPDRDDEQLERAEFIRSAVLGVRGEVDSARAVIDIGLDGASAGCLSVKPIETPRGIELDVRYHGTPSAEAEARRIKEVIADGDLLEIYYDSGHRFNGRQLVRQRLAGTPFPNLRFEDFTGYSVTKEKPRNGGGQDLHDAIGRDGDDSLFAWVVHRFAEGWLLCDDGPGEIADFLHLANDGTLTAIHVKAAGKAKRDRGIAANRFEQVVSQAEKNVRLLHNDELLAALAKPRTAAPAAWRDGNRVAAAEFVQALSGRVATDRTKVVIVQPHLSRARHDQARADAAAGRSSRDVCGLALLDTLLHSTRHTVTALWDDLIVVCAA